MDDREIMGSTDACAIPKWAPKKQLRYEVDDFIVSPPSNEDGGFFHLRFGRRTSPRPSTYDRINQELNMAVEIKDGDPLMSGVSLVGASEQLVSSPKLEITPTGLSPKLTPEPQHETTSGHSTKPLFVFHLKRDSKVNAEDPGSLKDIDDTSAPDVLTSALNQISLEKPESSHASSATAEKKNELTPEIPEEQRSKLTPDRQQKRENYTKESKSLTNIHLVEKVQTLPVTSPVELTPYTTPLTTPHTSPHSIRKIYGVVMEQQSSAPHSYFCTKPFMGSQKGSESSQAFASGGVGEMALSETSAQMTQQLEMGSRVAMAMEPGQKLAKKRRPKPSTLREMNFWAPTSM